MNAHTVPPPGAGTRSARPRVLMITQYYAPEPNFITASVAEAVGRCAEVTVITTYPNYPQGKFWKGTRYWRIEKAVDGNVIVWRVPFYPNHSLSLVARGFSYFSFAVMAMIVAIAKGGRPDVVWVYHGQFLTALAALPSRLRGARLVITWADLWPESLPAAGVSSAGGLYSLLLGYRRWLNRLTHTVIGTTRGTVETFAGEGVPRERLRHIPVWISAGASPVQESHEPGLAEKAIVYAGNLGPSQQLDTLLRAAAILASEGIAASIRIYGSGSVEDDLRRMASSLELTGVTFHGRVSPEEATLAIVRARAQYIALRPSEFFSRTIPSKLLHAFGTGTPILAGLHGESAELAAASGGAFLFDATDPASLAQAIRGALDLTEAEYGRMRASMRSYYRDHFEPSKLVRQYVAELAPGWGEADTGLAR